MLCPSVSNVHFPCIRGGHGKGRRGERVRQSHSRERQPLTKPATYLVARWVGPGRVPDAARTQHGDLATYPDQATVLTTKGFSLFRDHFWTGTA